MAESIATIGNLELKEDKNRKPFWYDHDNNVRVAEDQALADLGVEDPADRGHSIAIWTDGKISQPVTITGSIFRVGNEEYLRAEETSAAIPRSSLKFLTTESEIEEARKLDRTDVNEAVAAENNDLKGRIQELEEHIRRLTGELEGLRENFDARVEQEVNQATENLRNENEDLKKQLKDAQKPEEKKGKRSKVLLGLVAGALAVGAIIGADYLLDKGKEKENPEAIERIVHQNNGISEENETIIGQQKKILGNQKVIINTVTANKYRLKSMNQRLKTIGARTKRIEADEQISGVKEDIIITNQTRIIRALKHLNAHAHATIFNQRRELKKLHHIQLLISKTRGLLTSSAGYGGSKVSSATSGTHTEILGAYNSKTGAGTIWYHVENDLEEQFNSEPSDTTIEKSVDRVLRLNGKTWSDARELSDSYRFRVPNKF